VLHAIPAEITGSMFPLVEAQQHAGMRPFVLGRKSGLIDVEGGPSEPTGSGSLLRSWRYVREWKKQLDSYCYGGLEIVHAHCFSAGMAAVRRPGAVVYDLRVCVEELVLAERSSERSWLARSLQTAEQFVLARAGAVIVHSRQMLEHCRSRGLAEESLFLVPESVHAGLRLRSRSVVRTYDLAYRHAFAHQRTPGGENMGGGLVLQTSP
jgi:hypothetical protein